MRIACLTRITMAHGIRGGMERHLESVAEALVRRGHHVEVFTTAHPDGLDCEEIRGVHYHYLQSPAGRYRRAWWGESQRAILSRQGIFDVLWGQGAGAEPVARLFSDRRPPLVSILQGTFSGEVRTRLRNIHSVRTAALIPLLYWRHLNWRAHIERAERVIAASNEVALQVRDSYRRLPPIWVIPNGVDTIRFAPERDPRAIARSQLGLPLDARVLISIGRLEREKGFHQAIEMMTQLDQPDLHLLIVGRGSDENRLHQLVKRYGVSRQVHFAGFVPNTELPSHLNTADIFVMPTLRDEGFPITIAEAMACGLPIVATNIGGIPTAIDDGENGLLFPVGDVQALTTQVRRLLDESPLAEALGRAARVKVVGRFSVERMVDDTLSVFDEAAAGYRQRSLFPPHGLN